MAQPDQEVHLDFLSKKRAPKSSGIVESECRDRTPVIGPPLVRVGPLGLIVRRIGSRDDFIKLIGRHQEFASGLTELDASDLDLSTVDANRRQFKHCDFRGSDLSHATLDSSMFKFCDFRGATLRSASMRGVSLSGCTLRDADLRDADLRFAQLGRVNRGDPEAGRTDFRGARLDGARLTARACGRCHLGLRPHRPRRYLSTDSSSSTGSHAGAASSPSGRATC